MAHFQYSFDENNYLTNEERLLYISSSLYQKDWISMLHSHSFAEVLYITNGEGYFCTESKNIPINKDSLVLINPNLRHTEKSSDKHPLKYIALGIDNLCFNFICNEYDMYCIHDFKQHKEACLPIFSMMLDEVREQRQSSGLICQHLLKALLLKLQRITGDQLVPFSAQNIPSECETIKNYLDSHFHENISLDTLSEISHLNKYYMSHIFLKTFGISPITYLLERRILNSKQLLKSTDFSITQIAQMAGFSSENYFSQSFKRYTGMTPTIYRKIHK